MGFAPLESNCQLAADEVDDPRVITVLHVEDDTEFADLATIFLEKELDTVDVLTATSVDSGLERLAAERIDCIVSDYDMPNRNGLEFLATVREDHPELPFILFTGKGRVDIAAEAISAGVTAYFQKKPGPEQFTVLGKCIQNAVNQYNLERKIQGMNAILGTGTAGMSLLDEDGRFFDVTPEFAELYGYSPEELTGEHVEILYPDELLDRAYDDILAIVPNGGEWSGESTHLHRDGTHLEVDEAFSYSSDGRFLCFVSNVTEDGGR